MKNQRRGGFCYYHYTTFIAVVKIPFQKRISERGIHAFRKTFNSKLRCNGVSSIEAASLLGHSKEVNENYYTFDVSSLKEKADMVSKVIKKA